MYAIGNQRTIENKTIALRQFDTSKFTYVEIKISKMKN